MISVIIYGRNDSHGYNLPRRAALSFNCIAEILTDPNDEILFVDFNTPLGYPSFIESIDDTLTQKAKNLIKIICVPPEIHIKYQSLTHLPVNEPLARNIALRRSNPKNRWILSTNSDMIFVINDGYSLSEIVKKLENGSYGIPRYELPESLWECLDRKDPQNNIQTINQLAKDLNLNFVVYRDPWVIYDAPGDFQLMLREQLFEIHGFDESMLLGWHVDSNIAKRLFLLNGQTKSLINKISGYHCMHTRTPTNMHKHNAKSNDLNTFVFSVNNPYLPNQAENWGLPKEEFEMVFPVKTKAQNSLSVIKTIIQPNQSGNYQLTTHNCYANITYPSEHILAYISSILSTHPKKSTISYIGQNEYLLQSLEKLFSVLDIKFLSIFKDQILKYDNELPDEIYNQSNVFIFDFGLDVRRENSECSLFYNISSMFANTVKRNNNDLNENKLNLKFFIIINSKENVFERLTKSLIQCNDIPLSAFYLAGYPLVDLDQSIILNYLQEIQKYFAPTYIPFLYKHKNYQLNNLIHFINPHNNIKNCQDNNWSNASFKGTWTIGNQANLILRLHEIPKKDLKIKILLKPFLRSNHPKQEMELLINNVAIQQWQFKHKFFYLNRMIPKKKIRAVIPRSAIKNNELLLSFKIKYPSERCQFGVRLYNMIIS